jgi:hypothetical protein
MSSDRQKFTEQVTLKYVDSYYENNYAIEEDVVVRRPYSNIESQNEKGVCLFQCFIHFTKCNIEEASTCFECIEIDEPLGTQTRCCCSQRENNGLQYKVIKHKETGIKFLIGRVCFEKLFDGEKDKLKYFFQPTCKECGKKVKQNRVKTSGYCGIKCFNEFNEREEKIRIKKLWDDEAPKREAERKAWLEKERIRIEKEEEEKKKFPYGKHLICVLCGEEKKTDFERKYKWCKDCKKK